MTWIRGFIGELRAALGHFQISWVRALAADGDGPPSWFWPSYMTAMVLALVAGGFCAAADKAAYVIAVIPVFCGFVSLTFGLWLAYRGWKWIRAGKPTKQKTGDGQ